MHEFEDNESGKDDSLSADDTVVDGERGPFDILNDAGILTTPELSSFDESGRALQPILLVDFLGESEESENYESANSHEEEQIAASIHKRRMGNEIPVPRLVSPVTGFSLPTQQRLLEVSTSTPNAASAEAVAGTHLLWDDGHMVEVEISSTGARLPPRRSNRVRNNAKE